MTSGWEVDTGAHEDFVRRYNELNRSFRSTCVFSVGVLAGFFSEINNMIFAMLYCLGHGIRIESLLVCAERFSRITDADCQRL